MKSVLCRNGCDAVKLPCIPSQAPHPPQKEEKCYQGPRRNQDGLWPQLLTGGDTYMQFASGMLEIM
jgi:hypothetical protein